jgi:hypothetical protein
MKRLIALATTNSRIAMLVLLAGHELFVFVNSRHNRVKIETASFCRHPKLAEGRQKIQWKARPKATPKKKLPYDSLNFNV